MIKLTQGDILYADAEALVNTVNCVGVMGRGIALQFKKVFPENFKRYKAACDNKELLPGKMFVYDLNSVCNPRYVINFPTKRHWKGSSRMEDIESGLLALVAEVRKRNIHSIAIPPLGCGLGGLLWEEHFISGYGDAEDNPEREINLLPEILPQAESFLEDHPSTLNHFQKVVDIISGFETPFGMELLSTVHWVATRENATTADIAVSKTYDWNNRKQMFQEKHIRLAWDILKRKEWLRHPQSL
jgi:O-acetyl-ADP-ribose deacetylase (regulator of RNase III)